MKKIINTPSPRKKERESIPFIGGVSELIIVIFAAVLFILNLLLIASGVIDAKLFTIITICEFFISYLLIRHDQKTQLRGWEVLVNLFNKNKVKVVSKQRLSNAIYGKEFDIENQDKYSLSLKDGVIGGFILDGKDLETISSEDSFRVISDFNKALVDIKEEIIILKMNFHNDFIEYKKHLLYKNLNKSSEIENKISEEVIKNVEHLEDVVVKNNKYILFYWSNDKDDFNDLRSKITNSLKKRTNFISNELHSIEIKEVLDEVAFIDGDNEYKIRFDKTFIRENGKYYSYEYIHDIDSINDIGFMSRLFNSNDYDVYMNVSDLKRQSSVFREINKEIESNKQAILKNSEDSNKLKFINKSYKKYLDELKTNKTSLKEMSIIVRLEADSKKELKRIRKNFRNELLKDSIVIANFKYRQFEAFKQIMPTMKSSFRHLLQIETNSKFISNSWPLMNEGLDDEQGVIIGDLNNHSELIQFDNRIKEGTRINSNMFILASSGAGKTTTLLSMIDHNIKRREKVFILDPESEYTNIANYYGGQVIDLAGGGENMINPLQVIPDDGEYSEHIKSHLAYLDSFFLGLFKDITNIQLAKLREYINALYKKMKIDNDLINNDYESIIWPTFTDLDKMFNTKFKLEDEILKLSLIELKSYLNELVTGSYSHIWNGQTTIDLSSSLIVFDINRMVDNNRLTTAQMTLITKIVWGEIDKNYRLNENLSEDDKVWTSFIIDEAHLLMTKSNINSLEWISKVTKRIRKRMGSVYIITQNLSDFLGDEELNHISTKIINNCTYSLIGQLKPIDLNEYMKFYESYGGISQYEMNFLRDASRFQFVLGLGQEKKIYIKDTRPNELVKEVIGWKD